MKILHVGKFYSPFKGGIENALRDLAHGQADRGWEVDILAHHHAPWRATESVLDSGIRLTRCRILGSWLYTPVSPAILLGIPRRMARSRPDFVHLHLPNPSALAALLAPSRPPLILHWHADIVASAIDRRLPRYYKAYRPLERLLLQKAAAVVASSQAYLEHSEPLRDFRDKCRVIPLGLDRGRMAAADSQRNGEIRRQYGGRPLICSLGRLTYYKGYEHLIRAMSGLPEAALVIVGEGSGRPRLEALIRSLGYSDRIFLPGELEDSESHALLAACDVFCLPSVERAEAFGVSLLEAMHYSRPLVTTIIEGSGVGTVNIPGETGLSVPPGDAEALGRALRRLLADPGLRERYGRAAAERLEKCFTVERTVRAFEALYSELKP